LGQSVLDAGDSVTPNKKKAGSKAKAKGVADASVVVEILEDDTNPGKKSALFDLDFSLMMWGFSQKTQLAGALALASPIPTFAHLSLMQHC
jgi:hypothetical protein